MPDRIESESALIERYLAPLAEAFPGALGLLDDCAMLTPPPGQDLVLTVDAVAEGVHFLPDTAPEDIAWRALAVNASDLAGKAARPLAYLMSLAFPAAPDTAWLARFAAGLSDAQRAFAMALAGGDTDRRPGPLAITITAIGAVPEGAMVRRGGARPGDLFIVTGTLGDAALGLALRRDPSLGERWGLGENERRHLVGRYLRPEPRLGARDALLAHATAAMDISDGLAKDLGRLAHASGVSARVQQSALPLSPAGRRVLEREPGRIADIITGGDDYELLITAARENAAALVARLRACGIEACVIGETGEGDGLVIEDSSGRPVSLERTGWDHF